MTMESLHVKRTILVVDDNLHTLEIVRHALTRANFDVLVASSGEEGLELIQEKGLPHLAIVDLNMPPGISGFEFCQSVHQFSDLPIIMLTAVDEESTVVKGLDEHVEDYMTKPFNPVELTARVRGVLRRVGEFDYEFAPLTKVDDFLAIDFPGRRAMVNQDEVSLTPIESKLLYILMRRTGRTVPTEFIIRRIWPNEPAYEDRLHVHLHRLRRKLQKKNPNRYIHSERGHGYVFRLEQMGTPVE